MNAHDPLSAPATNPGGGSGEGGPPAPRVALRAVLQALGFLAGIALLVWCVKVALRPENREQLARFREAGAGEIAAILGLSFASLAVNGVVFWTLIRPVKRIDAGGVLATNALATFLNYLPFKVGVLTRVIVHNRRDGVPVVTIGAWFGAMGVVLLAALIPPCLVTLWLKRVDGAWFLATGAGVLALGGAVVLVAGALGGAAGAARLRRLVAVLPFGERFGRSKFFDQALAGAAILSDAPTVGAGIALRLLDIGLQAARFMVIAGVLHQTLAPGRAIMATMAYFMTGILSPGGMLGTREGVTAWLFGAEGAQSLTAAALLVGAAELFTNLVGAGIGLAYLRPDRLVKWKRESR